MGLFGGCNTGCSTGCNSGCGLGSESWIWIIILVSCCGCFDICEIFDSICGEESMILIVLVLFCVCGKQHKPMPIASPCGC